MATTTTRDARRPTLPPRAAPRPAASERRPFRDNPRLILLGILLLIGALAAMVVLADRSTDLSPDFISEVVLYALSAIDLTMLVLLLFVLGRNVVKLVVERRRGLPFSRFRAKLVLALLGLTIVPSVLVLLVGGELIRSSTERWFRQPIDDVMRSANEIARDYYLVWRTTVANHAGRIARGLAPGPLQAGDVEAVRRAIAPEVTQGRVGLVEVYRIVPGEAPAPLVAVESPSLPRSVRASPDRLAARVASGSSDTHLYDQLDTGGELVRVGALVPDPRSSTPVGVVIVSDYLPGEMVKHSRRLTDAYEGYSQLRVLKPALEGIYLSVFVMMTLMILVSATWWDPLESTCRHASLSIL